jgi:hypothetical protein
VRIKPFSASNVELTNSRPCGAEQRDWKESTSLVSTVQQHEVLGSSTIVRHGGHNKHRTSYRETTYHLGIGMFIVRHVVSTHGRNLSSPESVGVEFRFAEWFLAWGVNIATRREFGLFNVAIRTYRIVPADSAIFKACAMGDDEAVTRLIQEGKASPFDMTSTGVTPLHVRNILCCCSLLRFPPALPYLVNILSDVTIQVAAAWLRPSTSKQLLDYGADGSLAVDYFGRPVYATSL